MARYGTFLYNPPGAGAVLYGTQPSSSLDVEPFAVQALDYRRIDVRWVPPSGSFSRFRLIRNQGNIPENEEDGVYLIDTAIESEYRNTRLYRDGQENVGAAAVGLTPGGFVFYAIWLLLDDGWFPASYAYTLLATDHAVPLGDGDARTQTTHERIMDLLPRVYTTATGNPLDEVDIDSDLWTFLASISYTVDELMTYADLLIPDRDALNLSPERLALRAQELGLPLETTSSTRHQRRMVKDARNLFATKGTLQGAANAIEAITGFAPTVTESPNRLLRYQDGTFAQDTGLWEANAGVLLDAVDTLPPPTSLQAPNSIDRFFTGKATVTSPNAFLSYGFSSPSTLGIPVRGDVSYAFSLYAQRTVDTNITLAVTWHDFRGTALSTVTGTPTAATAAWTRLSQGPLVAPATAAFATLSVRFSAASVVHIDMVQFSLSSVTEYFEPRSVDVFLEPSKTNLLPNPSFEATGARAARPGRAAILAADASTTGWVIDAASSDVIESQGPAGVDTGARVLRVVTNAAGQSGVSATITDRPLGVWHSCAIYARCTVGEVAVRMVAAVSYSDQTPAARIEVPYTLTATWQRLYAVVSTCAACGIGPDQLGANPAVTLSVETDANNVTLELDAGQIETTYEPRDYFDGTYVAGGASWAGVDNASISYKYMNKISRLEQLRKELPNYLPMETPYRVITHFDGGTQVDFVGVA